MKVGFIFFILAALLAFVTADTSPIENGVKDVEQDALAQATPYEKIVQSRIQSVLGRKALGLDDIPQLGFVDQVDQQETGPFNRALQTNSGRRRMRRRQRNRNRRMRMRQMMRQRMRNRRRRQRMRNRNRYSGGKGKGGSKSKSRSFDSSDARRRRRRRMRMMRNRRRMRMRGFPGGTRFPTFVPDGSPTVAPTATGATTAPTVTGATNAPTTTGGTTAPTVTGATIAPTATTTVAPTAAA